MKRATSSTLVFALGASATLTGCVTSSGPEGSQTPAPTRSSLPPDAAEPAARDLLAPAGLALPEEARDVAVELVAHAQLEDASVTTFVAPQAVAEALCSDAGGRLATSYTPLDYEQAMLDERTVGPEDRTCSVGNSERSAFVIAGPEADAAVTVLVYRVPTR